MKKKLKWCSAVLILAIFGVGVVVALIGLIIGLVSGENWGYGLSSGSLELTGTVPEPYKTVFEAAGERWDVRPAFIAAIFAKENTAIIQSDYKNWPNPDGPWRVSKAGARGPFQFMPRTWSGKKGVGFLTEPNEDTSWKKEEGFRQDGDGDGKADVDNLWDAAFAAANKLALGGAGGNTDNKNLLRRAAWYYNHSSDYVEAVMTAYYRFSLADSQLAYGGSGSRLDVPCIRQEKNKHCGRASVAMIIAYYTNDYKTTDDPIFSSSLIHLLNRHTGSKKGHWKRGENFASPEGFRLLTASLDKGNPAIIYTGRWRYRNGFRKGNGYGHIMVVTGYDAKTDRLFINNPGRGGCRKEAYPRKTVVGWGEHSTGKQNFIYVAK